MWAKECDPTSWATGAARSMSTMSSPYQSGSRARSVHGSSPNQSPGCHDRCGRGWSRWATPSGPGEHDGRKRWPTTAHVAAISTSTRASRIPRITVRMSGYQAANVVGETMSKLPHTSSVSRLMTNVGRSAMAVRRLALGDDHELVREPPDRPQIGEEFVNRPKSPQGGAEEPGRDPPGHLPRPQQHAVHLHRREPGGPEQA